MRTLEDIEQEIGDFCRGALTGEEPTLKALYEREHDEGLEWLCWCMIVALWELPQDVRMAMIVQYHSALLNAATGCFAYGFLRGYSVRDEGSAGSR